LLERGSLTRQLQRHCRHRFNLELKNQGWGRPTAAESKLLKLRACEKTLIREVLLKCDQTSLVYARTVIPRKSLQGKNQILNRSNTRPLGAVLFARGEAPRKRLEYARFSRIAAAYPQVLEAEYLWARRSLFNFYGKPLLITEFFSSSLVTATCR